MHISADQPIARMVTAIRLNGEPVPLDSVFLADTQAGLIGVYLRDENGKLQFDREEREIVRAYRQGTVEIDLSERGRQLWNELHAPEPGA